MKIKITADELGQAISIVIMTIGVILLLYSFFGK
jgi:hypothetical protein